MYHRIVAANVRKGFQAMSQGDYQQVIKQFSPDIYFSFSGDHAMGGERHGIAQVTAWFEQMYRLFPGIQFEILQVTVKGWPWDTVAVTQFRIHAMLRDGRAYTNDGMQFLRIRWGRIVEDRVFEDTYKLVTELRRMGEQGVSEAVSTPVMVASV
jgi:ketosteroid isomerase-like protein